MKTKEGNKLIAEFCGWKYQSKEHNWKYSRIDWASWIDLEKVGHKELLFHSSWDWLMPVWKKVIEVIGLWCNTNGKEKVWHEANDNIRHHMFCEVDVEKTCKEISYLIQWYNKTKSQ